MIATLAEVTRLARTANVVPLVMRIPADLDTPVGVYLKTVRRSRHSFLLESIEGGEKLARYSFVAADPAVTISISPVSTTGDTEEPWSVTTVGFTPRTRKTIATRRPQDILATILASFREQSDSTLPRFTGGLVGYVGYGAMGWQERMPPSRRDTLSAPTAHFGLYRNVIAFDHLKQEIILIANILTEFDLRPLTVQYREARRWLENTTQTLSRNVRRRTSVFKRQTLRPQMSKASFEKMVIEAKRLIREGDIFQVVLSQRWSGSAPQRAEEIYRRLRRINPSPYMFLLSCGDISLVGASPEMLARVEGGTVETRPIAGTRPRGASVAEDQENRDSLRHDTKELAEHTMLVDLGRNDIGRIAEPGSVRVTQNMIIESYSHVMHLVSSVEGTLRKNVTPFAAALSCFPAGTVSGAPKIRAMETIAELEPIARGPYAGAILYAGFGGAIDSCITIRTIMIQSGKAHIQAGAGIVADSDPTREYEETRHKARALAEALGGTIK